MGSRIAQDQHLLLRHLAHRPGNAAHAVARLPSARRKASSRCETPCGRSPSQPTHRDARRRGARRRCPREDAGLEGERQRVGGRDRLVEFACSRRRTSPDRTPPGATPRARGGFQQNGRAKGRLGRRPPPICACPARPAIASSTHVVTRSASRGWISGPTSVCGESGSPTRSATNARREPVNELGYDVGMNEDPLGRHANLAGVVVAALDHGLDDATEIGAAVHDGGRHAPVLQGRPRSRRELAGAGDQPTRAEPMKLKKATRGSVASRSARRCLPG